MMAYDYHRGGCIFILLVALIQMWGNEFTLATGISANKTIKSDDGDTIDCIDIYKQPAFSHPLLKHHTLQMKHNSYPGELESRNLSTELFQSWHKNGECPLGTIPILRTPNKFGPRKVAPPRNGRFNRSFAPFDAVLSHEYATVNLPYGNYIGARGSFNVWIPKVANTPSAFSLSQLWVVSEVVGSALNTMEAGWMVTRGDNHARFFIYWTSDDYKSTGCYNLDCPGFVQISHKIALGARIIPTSTYAGKQFEVKFTIKRDQNTGDWVLLFEKHVVGYWPKAIFTSFATSATWAAFGGEITNTKPHGHFTTTQMGSGHFASGGYGKAAYVAHIGYIDNGNVFKDANRLLPLVTAPSCYNLNIIYSPQLGEHIYFGGPGFSPPGCQ